MKISHQSMASIIFTARILDYLKEICQKKCVISSRTNI